MTVKDVFDLRKQGKIEEAYDAIRPMYRVHKGRYTTLCMFWVASDIFKKRMDEGRTEEARKIFEALKRMQPRVDAINKEFDTQSATKRQEKKTFNSSLLTVNCPPATAFLQYAEKRLGAKGTSNAAKKELLTFHSSLLTESSPKLSRLLAILDRPLSVKEMMAALGFGSRDKFLKNYLSPALKSGLVEMTQPDSPKSPKQKYRRSQGDK